MSEDTRSSITRRRFSASLLAAAGGGAVARSIGAQADPASGAAPAGKIPPSVVQGIPIGVATYTYRALTFEQIVESLRKVGISNLEIWGDGPAHRLHPVRQDEAEFKRVKRLLDDNGIAVGAYCTNFPNDATPEHLDKAFVGCALLGAEVMTTSIEKPVLDRLDEAARRHKIKVGLHNHWNGDAWFVRARKDPKANFESPEDWDEAFKGRSEYLAVNLDVGHFSAAGLDPVAFFRKNHERVVAVHLKDRAGDPEHKYVPFGAGATPLPAFCQALKDLRYRGGVNLEYELDEKDPTPGVAAAYAYVKKLLG
jgi:sugar phosphate isomerase/epimerase